MLAQQGKHGESLPPLTRLFHPGQLVRSIVTGLRTGAAAEPEPRAPAGQKRKRGAPQKLIELSLEVARVCAGVAADEGLREGMALPACVRSVEDHGYTLLLGPQGAEGGCASLSISVLSLNFTLQSPVGHRELRVRVFLALVHAILGAHLWMAAHPLHNGMLLWAVRGVHLC